MRHKVRHAYFVQAREQRLPAEQARVDCTCGDSVTVETWNMHLTEQGQRAGKLKLPEAFDSRPDWMRASQKRAMQAQGKLKAPSCIEPGCDRLVHGRERCHMHYRALRRAEGLAT